MRLAHLPPDSAVAALERDGKPPWTMTDYLLDDQRMHFEAVNSKKGHQPKPHPLRPTGAERRLDPQRLAAGRRRRVERARAIEAGEIT